MAKEGSVAPKERVNIVYRPATGNAQEDVELPLKILMVGDYQGEGQSDPTPLEERKPINVDKDSFAAVMAQQGLELTMSVPNRLTQEPDARLAVQLHFGSLKDFEPEGIVRQVPELQQLLALRAALSALKGPMGNLPAFRKKIQALLTDDATRARLMAELGLSHDETPTNPNQPS